MIYVLWNSISCTKTGVILWWQECVDGGALSRGERGIGDSTHSSKVRCLVDHSCALFLPDVVISHHLEGAGLATLP